MKLKTTISMLAVAASAVAVHANTISETTSTLGLTVTSSVIDPTGSGALGAYYEYTYSASSTGPADAFTVGGIVNPSGITGEGSTGNWTTGSASDSHVSWTSTTTDQDGKITDTTLATYWFYSLYAPTDGIAFAQDSQPFGPTAVYVPNTPSVPDTGVTMSLLSGALLGLAGLRRKLGC